MSNRSDLNFRFEQYHNIEELLERARMLNESPQTTSGTSTAREVEKTDKQGPRQIAHPTSVDPSKQFDDNMRVSQFSNPEAFARNRDSGNKVVVKTSGRNHDFGHTAQRGTPVGVKVGGARHERNPQTEQATFDNPSWAEFGVAGRFIQDEAAQAIAQLERAANQTFSRKSTEAMGQSHDSTHAAQVYFDATADRGVNENTNVNYDYQNDSAWERVLADLGPMPGTIETGEGAPLAPKVLDEVTKTFAQTGKKR